VQSCAEVQNYEEKQDGHAEKEVQN
jgi:hypothetical protein